MRQTEISKFSDPKPWEIHKIPKNYSSEVLNKAQIARKDQIYFSFSSDFFNNNKFCTKAKFHLPQKRKEKVRLQWWYLHSLEYVQHGMWTQKNKRNPETRRGEETKNPWIPSVATLEWLVRFTLNWMSGREGFKGGF